MHRRSFLTRTSLAALSLSTLTEIRPFPARKSNTETAKKILFLGDSITQAGDYINFFECQLRIAHPDNAYEIYNLGLGSETISGLSEENHPYPRPNLHERLAKVLHFVQPDIIYACYGINCGIYHPFGEQRFTRYRQGIQKLMVAADQAQAELILLTPPPFAAPVKDWQAARKDQNRKDYSYTKPYAAYDEVMQKYAEWIMQLQGVQSMDIQTPLRAFQDICYGEDVIHPNLLGHQLMAHGILENLQLVNEQEKNIEVRWKEASKNSGDENVKLFHLKTPANNHVLLSENQEYNELITSNLDFTLKIRDCPPATYQLFDGQLYLGQFTHDALKEGITLGPLSTKVKYENLSFDKKARQMYDLIAARREVYDYALLQHIGHQRPMQRTGLPLALAEKKKETLDAEIAKLLSANQWTLELIRVSS